MLGQELKVTDRRHPPGETGVRTSLEQVAKLISDGGRHPKVVAWAREQLERGRRQLGWKMGTDRERAAVLLRAVQKKLWIPDPVATEFMAGAHLLACDKSTKDELCMVSGDCDELAGLLGASLLAVGIDTMVVGHGYRENRISHVLVAARVDGSWQYADPSTDLPLGKCVRFERERILSVPNVQVLCDDKSCLSDRTAYNPNDHDFAVEGYFVGVDGVPRFAWIADGFLGDKADQVFDACKNTFANQDVSTAAARERSFGNASRCAADAYCGTYGVPPGICSTVVGPIADKIAEVWSDIFGGTPSTDCSRVSVFDSPCHPCALAPGLYQYEAKQRCEQWLVQQRATIAKRTVEAANGVMLERYYAELRYAQQQVQRKRGGTLEQAQQQLMRNGLVPPYVPNMASDAAVPAITRSIQSVRSSYQAVTGQVLYPGSSLVPVSPLIKKKSESSSPVPKVLAVGALGFGAWWLWLR